MHIRKAGPEDLEKILAVYLRAQKFMRENGNPNQWNSGYPSKKLLAQNMEEGKLYVCTEGDKIAGVFYFAVEEDPSYHVIEDGAWQNDAPYAVVHRLASAEGRKGTAAFCLAWALKQAGNVRIDTHRDNIPMQKLLNKLEFTYCGIIRLMDGSPRMAFQKVKTAD